MASGYGRGWREPKAHGIARLLQWLREPQTKDDSIILALMIVIGVISIVVMK